jgi:hypothetical protein
MAQLVFQSVSGGTTTLNGTNTAGTYNLTVPAADGTLLYSDTSGNITFNNVTITGLLSITGTSALGIPVGNTVQRPTPAAGQIRYNTDGGGLFEGYLPAQSAWYKFTMAPEGQYTMQYLVTAGGGGASGNGSGGGGAGGLLTGSVTAIPSTLYTVTLGGGGSGGYPSSSNGSNSSITGVVTVFGGGASASSGGSGGGGYAGYGPNPDGTPGGAGITYQGNDGGHGGASTIGTGGGGGGGGAGAVGGGGGANNNAGGGGGAGYASAITGITVSYAGGGGGGNSGGGGSGGGGGGAASGGNGSSGGANTGGGGGAGGNGATNGGNGGSGICILSVPTANYTGTVTGTPTVTTSGSQTIMKFTISGSYLA